MTPDQLQATRSVQNTAEGVVGLLAALPDDQAGTVLRRYAEWATHELSKADVGNARDAALMLLVRARERERVRVRAEEGNDA